MSEYILDGKTPVKCTEAEWFAWTASKPNRAVAKTQIGDVQVSTVFLCLDHQFGEGPPLLFETMIFGGAEDQYCERCSTWEQAEEQHRIAVDMVNAEK